MLDPRTGEVRLGPAVRLEDGSVHQYGAIPPKGATVRLVSYRTGGGSEGNVAAGAISQLRSSIPYVASVKNFKAASGGVDAESIDEARERGPLLLRTRNRAVTAEDYEILAREAAPETARVRCVLVEEGADAGCLRILVVPSAPDEDGRIEFRQLVPDNDTGERIQAYLDERRVVGTRLRIEPPSYVGVKVEASLRARPNADPDRLRDEARQALYRYFNPLSGGPDGTGWPFGRPVQLGEVFGVLQRVRGIDLVENAVILRANPVTGELSDPEDRIELGPTNLVFSYEHVVEVQ
jgi:predicted phage baseplate assembly protein